MKNSPIGIDRTLFNDGVVFAGKKASILKITRNGEQVTVTVEPRPRIMGIKLLVKTPWSEQAELINKWLESTPLALYTEVISLSDDPEAQISHLTNFVKLCQNFNSRYIRSLKKHVLGDEQLISKFRSICNMPKQSRGKVLETVVAQLKNQDSTHFKTLLAAINEQRKLETVHLISMKALEMPHKFAAIRCKGMLDSASLEEM
jgi:hypothetical protein